MEELVMTPADHIQKNETLKTDPTPAKMEIPRKAPERILSAFSVNPGDEDYNEDVEECLSIYEDEEPVEPEKKDEMLPAFDKDQYRNESRCSSSLGEVTVHGGRARETGGGTGFGDLAAEFISETPKEVTSADKTDSHHLSQFASAEHYIFDDDQEEKNSSDDIQSTSLVEAQKLEDKKKKFCKKAKVNDRKLASQTKRNYLPAQSSASKLTKTYLHSSLDSGIKSYVKPRQMQSSRMTVHKVNLSPAPDEKKHGYKSKLSSYSK